MAEQSGIERIAAERQRQIDQEAWTPEHDEQHKHGELAMAAALYATPSALFSRIDRQDGGVLFEDPWPWWCRHGGTQRGGPTKEWDKRAKHPRLRQLEIAGALIAAEIDRLERAALAELEAPDGR